MHVGPKRWSIPMQLISMREGWLITRRATTPKIQKSLTFRIFDTDEAAIDYVQQRAREGSARHRRALAIVTLQR